MKKQKQILAAIFCLFCAITFTGCGFVDAAKDLVTIVKGELPDEAVRNFTVWFCVRFYCMDFSGVEDCHMVGEML